MHLRFSKLVPILFGFALAGPAGTASELVESKKIVESAEPEPLFAFSITPAWDSRYVSEGRDNLDGDSLFGATTEISYLGLPFGEIMVGTWYAWTPDSPAYSEFNAFAEYSFEIGEFGAYFGYNHLRFYPEEQFHPDDNYDNEIGAGVSYGLPLNIGIGADWYYSFDANGSFFELILEGEYEVCKRLTLVPSALLGFNAGYIAAGHDGANNVAVGLEAVVPVNDYIELAGYTAYNWAIDRDFPNYPDDEILRDFFYGGVRVTISF